jgi:hypothetical protein
MHHSPNILGHMSPYNDPAVSAGEIAECLYSQQLNQMNTESQITPAPLADAELVELQALHEAVRALYLNSRCLAETSRMEAAAKEGKMFTLNGDTNKLVADVIRAASWMALTSPVPGLLVRLAKAEAQVVKVYEVIDKEFDQHASDRHSNCTPEQAQFYQHCEGAIAILRMRLERVVPEPKADADDFIRASGDAICGNCNQPYKRHRFDYSELCDGVPYLNVLCEL